MAYTIDKNSILYKTLEFNEKLRGGGETENAESNNTKLNESNNDEELEKRKEARKEFFRVIMKILGAILYIFYLPLIPWIKITQSSLKNMGGFFSGTLMPL